MDLIHPQQNNRINIEVRAKDIGYRNFTSFIFIHYYGDKATIKKCGSLLGVSYSKVRQSIVTREWPIRSRSQCLRPKPKKRKVNIWKKTCTYTPFIFPWCAIYYYYNRCLLTSYEVAKIFHISQFFLLKKMRKYGIKRRKQGEQNTYGYFKSCTKVSDSESCRPML